MSFSFLVENESFSDVHSKSKEELIRYIENFDDLISSMLDSGDSVSRDIDENFYNDEISEWIFFTDDDAPILKEYKLVLLETLQKLHKIKGTYEEIKNVIESQSETIPKYDSRQGFVSFIKENQSLWYVSTKTGWINLHRFYLRNVRTISDFFEYIGPCFPNLFFHENVQPSMRTLNQDFVDLRGEIIDHLIDLNNFYDEILRFRENTTEGYPQLADKFTDKTKKRCGPQSDRGEAHKLDAVFRSATLGNIELCCELHTKFSNHNGNPLKQNRLYFHPGRTDIEGGKILIFHIGDHA